MPISATCVRVPVMVGHSEAVWVELERPLAPDEATAVLREAPSVRVLDLPDFPTPLRPPAATRFSSVASAGTAPSPNGLALYLSCDNLRKGAALNAIQIAELLLAAVAATSG